MNLMKPARLRGHMGGVGPVPQGHLCVRPGSWEGKSETGEGRTPGAGPLPHRVHAPRPRQELARLEIPAELAVMLRKEEGESCLPGVTLSGTPPQPLIV